jgi:hypothetical protein
VRDPLTRAETAFLVRAALAFLFALGVWLVRVIVREFSRSS